MFQILSWNSLFLMNYSKWTKDNVKLGVISCLKKFNFISCWPWHLLAHWFKFNSKLPTTMHKLMKCNVTPTPFSFLEGMLSQAVQGWFSVLLNQAITMFLFLCIRKNRSLLMIVKKKMLLGRPVQRKFRWSGAALFVW